MCGRHSPGYYTSETYTPGGSIPVKIKLSDSATEVWVNGTKEYTWGATSGSGGVAFGGWQAKFDNIKVGYDNNDDDDLDDVGDDLVFSQDFSSTSDTFAYDDAGNLVKDSQFIYTYDAWHRLVTAVSAEDDDITIGAYTYDALGRRIRKVVTNAGDLDGTELYFYGKGHQVIEVRDGSENMIRQVVHGTRYIDEVVLEILEDGVAWVHQDANYNVIALTDFASQTLEHTYYTPYGIQTVDQETYWGDYDGDGLVTAAEANDDGDGNVLDEGDTCYGADPTDECRIYDFDFDGDVDATDSTKLATLISATTYRQPGRPYSGIGNTRAHQGLIYDAEIGSYQNRRRQYAPALRRFMEADPYVYLTPMPVTSLYFNGMNQHAYVQSNPLALRDPTGLCTPGTGGGTGPSLPKICGPWGIGVKMCKPCEKCLFSESTPGCTRLETFEECSSCNWCPDDDEVPGPISCPTPPWYPPVCIDTGLDCDALTCQNCCAWKWRTGLPEELSHCYLECDLNQPTH